MLSLFRNHFELPHAEENVSIYCHPFFVSETIYKNALKETHCLYSAMQQKSVKDEQFGMDWSCISKTVLQTSEIVIEKLRSLFFSL